MGFINKSIIFFLKFNLLVVLCHLSISHSALSPSAMERVDADLMNKMYEVFEETNTQELFVVEDFERKDINLFFITLTTANAKIRSLKDGLIKELGYSVWSTNKPGIQSGVANLEAGRTYFMRINCNDSVCTPPFHKFFNYSVDEYQNYINKHLSKR